MISSTLTFPSSTVHPMKILKIVWFLLELCLTEQTIHHNVTDYLLTKHVQINFRSPWMYFQNNDDFATGRGFFPFFWAFDFSARALAAACNHKLVVKHPTYPSFSSSSSTNESNSSSSASFFAGSFSFFPLFSFFNYFLGIDTDTRMIVAIFKHSPNCRNHDFT